MTNVDYLTYLKNQQPVWRKSNVINLASSGFSGGEKLLLTHKSVYCSDLDELLRGDYASEWGFEPLKAKLREVYDLPAASDLLTVPGLTSGISLVYQVLASTKRFFSL